MLVAAGCSTTPTMKSIVGTYEIKIGKTTTSPPQSYRVVFFENGKVESYEGNGEKGAEDTWKLVEKEVHIEEVTDILKIEPNGDLTVIALIEDGKRAAQKRITLKKLK